VSDSDSSFFRTLIIVLATLTAFMLFSIAIARVLTSKPEVSVDDAMYQAAVLERIKPVGMVSIGGSSSTASAGVVKSGAEVYKASCFACHGTGAAGAPKLGDKAAWKARIGQGMATLISHALKGFKGMPAKGGNAALSDGEVKAAVKHLVAKSK